MQKHSVTVRVIRDRKSVWEKPLVWMLLFTFAVALVVVGVLVVKEKERRDSQEAFRNAKEMIREADKLMNSTD